MKDPLIEQYMRIKVVTDVFAEDFFEDFTGIPGSIRNFIDYFKRYDYHLISRDNTGIMEIETPIDFYFLTKILEFEPQWQFGDSDSRLRFRDTPYFLKVMYDQSKELLYFENGSPGYYLPTNVSDLLIVGKDIFPVRSVLSTNIVSGLFKSGKCAVSHDMKVKLLIKKKDEPEIIDKYISLPSIRKFNEKKILIDFQKRSGIYNLQFFLYGKNEHSEFKVPLLLKETRRISLLNEEIVIPFSEKEMAIIPPDDSFYADIRNVVNEVFNNFYEFLNEIRDNQIQTGDNENLFQKFLPNVRDKSVLQEKGETFEIVFDTMNKLRIEVPEFSETKTLTQFGKIDWLEVKFHFEVQNIELSLSEIRAIIREGYVKKEGRIITLSAQEIDNTKELLNEAALQEIDGKWMIRRYHLPFMLTEKAEFTLPDSIAHLPSEIKSEQAVHPIPVPEPLNNVLRNYQKTGFNWLHFLHRYAFGGILADEMGLGKTVEILSFLLSIRGEGTSLIICPSSLIYNWANEIDKFIGEQIDYIVIAGTRQQRIRDIESAANYDIVITSYYMAHLDIEEYKKIDFLYCILDEAQHIKNKAAKRTQSIKDIQSRNRIAITGTPLENNIGELWSIFDFLMPGFLGNHQWFRQHFENPINGFDNTERKIAFHKLKDLIRPFVLRRTKASVIKELPDKIEQVLFMELTEKQKAVYVDTLSRVRTHYFQLVEQKGWESTYMDFLAALTRLRQICLHPALTEEELRNEEAEEISVKLSALIELIQEAIDSGHRVLVFSQFVKMLQLIRNEFHVQEIEYLYLDGKTKNRVRLVDEFNQSDIPVFLISLKAGGTGLNLTGADSVILFDPWWNPSVENQAIDRAHRIGQEKVVNVYRLLTKGTIEEKIYQLQQRKKAVFDSVMTADDTFVKKMTWEDVQSLFNWEERIYQK